MAHGPVGNRVFQIFPTPYAGTAQHTQAGCVVDDLRSVVDDLRARGVVFEEYDLPGVETVDGIAQLGTWSRPRGSRQRGRILSVSQFLTDPLD